jgi:putrescine transport system permease protein
MKHGASGNRPWGRGLIRAVPALWLIVFTLVPFLIVLKISFSQTTMTQPPYAPVFDPAAGWQALVDFVSALSTGNYETLWSDTLYVRSYLKSLEVAALSTAMLLVLGYPVAYGMARTRRFQTALLTLVILPFWTSFLIRVYAWINILQHDGLLNRTLLALHLVDHPLIWLSTDTAVYLGIVYSYFPFMVLPLYSTLERLDPSLYEAAADLGCPPWKSFWLLTVPMSRPGIVAGSLLCFIPIVGEFVIPDLLGGSRTVMIGQTLWTEFFANRDWPVASAVAVVLLALLIVPIVIYQHQQLRAIEAGR